MAPENDLLSFEKLIFVSSGMQLIEKHHHIVVSAKKKA
jgi:hypothetical protein